MSWSKELRLPDTFPAYYTEVVLEAAGKPERWVHLLYSKRHVDDIKAALHDFRFWRYCLREAKTFHRALAVERESKITTKIVYSEDGGWEALVSVRPRLASLALLMVTGMGLEATIASIERNED